jgi:hypothetical protein
LPAEKAEHGAKGIVTAMGSSRALFSVVGDALHFAIIYGILLG